MIFDPLTASTLLILAAADGQSLCKQPKPTKIEVVPRERTLRFDYSKSLKDIAGVETDTIDPHGFGGIAMPQGFTASTIKMKPKVKLESYGYKAYNAACIWYDSIIIELEIDPVVTIAREVNNDACMSVAVKNHEMKHVRTLRKVVNKYSDIMGREVFEALKDRGFMAGPVKADQAQQVADRMYKTVYQVLDHEYKKMDIEHTEAQSKIDSRQEYEYISSLCPNFNPTPSKSKRRR